MKYLGCFILAFLLNIATAVKVKVIMHSEQDDSKTEDDDVAHTETWDAKKRIEITMLPFLKKAHNRAEEKVEFEEEKPTTEKSHQLHPNELIFPLIYRQVHINSMFKFGENWYTWATEKRTDGSRGTNYYICYDEPKRCDEIGWERTDALPKCALQIDSLMPDDRACVYSFGVEPHSNGACDGGDQMKVSELVRSCGPRVRSLWRFLRAGRRPASAAKPADVNSLVCEDEEECYISIEYRIHHDRITFSLHEPTRGQTYKSALKRDLPTEDDNKVSAATQAPRAHKKAREESAPRKKFRVRARAEGKGVAKPRAPAHARANKLQPREDVSEDLSE